MSASKAGSASAVGRDSGRGQRPLLAVARSRSLGARWSCAGLAPPYHRQRREGGDDGRRPDEGIG